MAQQRGLPLLENRVDPRDAHHLSISDQDDPSESDLENKLQYDLTNRKFWIMSTFFGINHGVVTTPIVYATSLLGDSAGYDSLATLYFLTILSSLFIGAPVIAKIGYRIP